MSPSKRAESRWAKLRRREIKTVSQAGGKEKEGGGERRGSMWGRKNESKKRQQFGRQTEIRPSNEPERGEHSRWRRQVSTVFKGDKNPGFQGHINCRQKHIRYSHVNVLSEDGLKDCKWTCLTRRDEGWRMKRKMFKWKLPSLKKKKKLFGQALRETCTTIIIIINHYQWAGDDHVCFPSAHHNYQIIWLNFCYFFLGISVYFLVRKLILGSYSSFALTITSAEVMSSLGALSQCSHTPRTPC